jgi:hypothetical protein
VQRLTGILCFISGEFRGKAIHLRDISACVVEHCLGSYRTDRYRSRNYKHRYSRDGNFLVTYLDDILCSIPVNYWTGNFF